MESDQGGLLNLAVDARNWIPAGCEVALSRGFTLSSQGPPGPFGGPVEPRPAGWAVCQNRAVELLASEYQQRPDIVAIDSLSKALDSLNMADPQALQRLARLRLMLKAWYPTPSVADLVAVLGGSEPLPQRPPETSAMKEYPFVLSEKSRAGIHFRARGEIRGFFVVVDEGVMGVDTTSSAAGRLKIDAGLCFQLLGLNEWRVMATTRTAFIPDLGLQLDLRAGEERTFQRSFSAVSPPVPLNVPRYWVCFRVETPSGEELFFHADDATAKGCSACA